MSKWEKLPPVKGGVAGCLNCGLAHDTLPLNAIVAVGFGDAHVSKDGEVVWREDNRKRLPTLRTFENRAAKDPDHDWRAVLNGPLHGETYQRQGPKEWVLVGRTQGFA
jgi:hypothetical protein